MSLISNKRGFTLVEFLIALTLIALITALLFSGIRMGWRSWEAVEKRSERLDEMRLMRGFIRRNLAQVRGVHPFGGEQNMLLFWGNGKMIEWVSPMPSHSGTGGLAIFRLSYLEGDEGLGSVVLDRWLYHPDSGDDQSKVPSWEPLAAVPVESANSLTSRALYSQHILSNRVEALEINYYGDPVREGENPEWLSEWGGNTYFPLLVKLKIDYPNDSWPEMVVDLPRKNNKRVPSGFRGVSGLIPGGGRPE